jgi:HAD superfamily hydrolase (TIGR01509 family)
VTALILDCDGVIGDTERFGHLPAFNETFRQFGLPVQWSAEEYGRLLKIGGGKERMATLLTPEFVAAAGLPADPEAQALELARWHARKTALYTEMISAGRIPARPGIARLVAEAQHAGWTLAVASTSAEASVRAILEYAVGRASADRFDLVLAGDVVAHKKPAPDIYLLAIERLGVQAAQALVIEDSRNGMLSAIGAGLRCLVTVSDYTVGEDFDEAVMVVSSLGDPGGEKAMLLANRGAARPGDWLTLDDLRDCLR